ncbi:MAG TPA: methyltransferase domain-containing protein [Terriglobales bacterium]|nr:methyltransferase domain-containing protein [Terriglobales bacterium]
MGKGAALRWAENRYLRRYFQGRGLEIGGLWRKFKVSPQTKVWYVDRLSTEELARQYSEVDAILVAPDLIADAELLPIGSASVDFLIASHVLEHLRFPLDALRSWYEALKPGGYLLLKIPDKRFTFDRHRKRTTLQHLIEEAQNPADFDVPAHYADWVQFANHFSPGTPAFIHQLEHLMAIEYSIHYHVWIDEDVRELTDYTQQALKFDWYPVVFWRAHFFRKECVVLLQKNYSS